MKSVLSRSCSPLQELHTLHPYRFDRSPSSARPVTPVTRAVTPIMLEVTPLKPCNSHSVLAEVTVINPAGPEITCSWTLLPERNKSRIWWRIWTVAMSTLCRCCCIWQLVNRWQKEESQYSQTWNYNHLQTMTTDLGSHFEFLLHKWPLKNDHLSTKAKSLGPKGGVCRQVWLYFPVWYYVREIELFWYFQLKF